MGKNLLKDFPEFAQQLSVPIQILDKFCASAADIRNAGEAINESGRPGRCMALGVRAAAAGRVPITVTDNGVGIASENLTRILALGFTTKKADHGFGLHSSSLIAKEMGGPLVAQGDGPGRGVNFAFRITVCRLSAPSVNECQES